MSRKFLFEVEKRAVDGKIGKEMGKHGLVIFLSNFEWYVIKIMDKAGNGYEIQIYICYCTIFHSAIHAITLSVIYQSSISKYSFYILKPT